MTYQVGIYDTVRLLFRQTGILSNLVDGQFDAADNQLPVFAFTHDLGIVGTNKTAPIIYTVGHYRDPLVQLLNIPNTYTLLGAYYLTRYNGIPDMVRPRYVSHASETLSCLPKIAAILNDYPNTLVRAIGFDNQLNSDALAVTPDSTDYADILALSARQVFGNIELTCGWNGTAHVPAGSMAFLRGTYVTWSPPSDFWLIL